MPELQWIEIDDRPPEKGQWVICISFNDMTWVEKWGKNKPRGHMAGWYPIPAVIRLQPQE